MSLLRRGYLNTKEEDMFLMLIVVMLYVNGDTNLTKKDNIVDRFKSSGMLTKYSQKNLKTGLTFISKFLKETYENLDKSTQSRIDKKSYNFNLKFTDSYTSEKLDRNLDDKLKYAVIERTLFDEIIEDIAQVRCVNCNKSYKECELYSVLEDSLKVCDGEKKNCPYACDL